MAELTRSQVLAFKKETTEGTLEALTAGTEFVPSREGTSITNALDSVDTDELVAGDIGASAPVVVGSTPSLSWPFYVRHSGVEGQAPNWGVTIESSLGDVDTNGTEHDTIAASTTSVIKLDVGEGASHPVGSALLIKDGTNGYEIRNVDSVSTDDLTMNFNIANAPASGVNTGKHVLYRPVGTGHPTYSAYRYQAASSSAFKEAVSGVRTTSLGMEFPAKDLITGTVEGEGLKYYWNQVVIDATNNKIDITDDGGVIAVTLESKVYATQLEFAAEVATKCTAASVGSGDDVISCVYDSSTGRYTLSSSGSTFELLWLSGANNATGAYAELGFDKVDETGATTYTSDSAATYDPDFTPDFDDADVIVARNAELLLGDNDEITCRKASNISLTIDTPKTDVNSICAVTGRAATLTLERTVTLSATLILEEHEAEIFDRAINNTTTKFMFNFGEKDSSGNWEAGKCINVYMQSAKINATPVQDQDGYAIIALEATGFVTSSTKDVYINFI